MQQFETTVASLAKRGEQLVARRATAQNALQKAVKDRQDALLSGALDDNQPAIEKLQAAVDTAASALSGIDDAISVLTQQKADAEHQLAAECERVKRVAAAEKLEARLATIEEALPKYGTQSRLLAGALAEVAGWHWESRNIETFVRNAVDQVDIAMSLVLAELKTIPSQIREGLSEIPREPPAPEPEPVAPTTPSTLTVFMMRSAKFRDAAGMMRTARQYDDAEMPVQTAQRALRRNVAVPVTDPRRANLKGARGGFHPDPRAPDIVDLDDEEATRPSQIASVTCDPHANFIVLDRSGENRTLQIAVPRL